ncbi:MAG: hypothetical protein JWP08_2391 [Bryobacterales bacterium]|jgi:hypothetical protein|nr:hypothetical protein [Bryobacterales bacterium]
MKTLVLILQNAGRLLGVILLILGFLFWTHHSFDLIPLHTGMGVAFVALLWAMAAIGASAKVNPSLVIAAFLWGLLVLYFGMSMGRFLPGRAHEAIRVLHFLIGLSAIALLESLGARIKRRAAAVR